MGFLADYAALSQTVTDPAQLAKAQAGLTQQWLGGRTQELFQELRESRPIFLAPGLACVAAFDDVVEVLTRDRVFTVRPYVRRMQRTTGDFFLGMGRTPQYDREVSIMRLAASRDDLPRLHSLIADTVKRLLARAKGRLDLVNDYARATALTVVQQYFGVPGPDDATLRDWLRILFWDIFINLGDDPTVVQRASVAATGLKAYLLQLIRDQRAAVQAGKAPDTVLTRLLRMQAEPTTALDDDAVRRNIGGTIVGAVDTVSRAFVQAIDQLLQRPEAFAQARSAAAAGNDEVVARCVWEAMRFNPQNPYLYRLCEQPYILGAGTPRATLIPPGTLVFAGTQSAMFDTTRLPEPETMRLDRRPEDYLFFGFGQHTCFGLHIAPVEFLELARGLLRLPNLRPAAGAEGQIQYEGPFPQTFWVEWDASQQATAPATNNAR